MRHLVTVLLVVSFLLTVAGAPAQAIQEPPVSADAAILVDAHTGQILYEKNAFELKPPASTTKIATALMALEMGDPEATVTVSERAARVGESSMHLIAGEKLTLEQLLTGALVRSGNDACVAIAEHLAGSESLFMDLVNTKLKFLGAKDTHFVNPNGLPARGHVSTAHDLALVTRYALLNSTFCRIVGTRFAEVHGSNHWKHMLTNTNKLLWRYPGATGVKTGTTNEAGQCLVASALRGGTCLITVVLHSDDRYQDAIQLFEYGFNNFQRVTLVEKGEVVKKIPVNRGDTGSLPLVADRSVIMLNPVSEGDWIKKKLVVKESVKLPVERGSKQGQVLAVSRGRVVGGANLVAGTSVNNRSFALSLLHRFTSGGK
jgi:D-alanyl-D-alanine carboxypeptidase (penicillin-binding protein 5/6)